MKFRRSYVVEKMQDDVELLVQCDGVSSVMSVREAAFLFQISKGAILMYIESGLPFTKRLGDNLAHTFYFDFLV